MGRERSGEGKDGGDEGEGRGGEVLLRRSKRRRHLPKIRTFKKFRFFFGQTDRQTEIVVIGKLHFQKRKK